MGHQYQPPAAGLAGDMQVVNANGRPLLFQNSPDVAIVGCGTSRRLQKSSTTARLRTGSLGVKRQQIETLLLGAVAYDPKRLLVICESGRSTWS